MLHHLRYCATPCIAALLMIGGASVALADAAKITIHGSGAVQIEPDLAVLRIGVNTRDNQPSAAQETNSSVVKVLIAALEKAGVRRKDMQTSSFTFQRLSDIGIERKSTEEVYRVSNQLNVFVRDITQLGKIIGISVKAGGNDIGQIDFLSSDPGKYVDQARKEAFADAKLEAEKSAAAAGLQLVGVIAISGGRATIPQSFGNYSFSPAATDFSNPNLEAVTLAGKVVIGYEVDVEYGLK